MAYLGTVPAEAYSPTAVKDSFNGDGSTVAFTMSQPSKTNDVRVVVENVVQDPTVAYSCSGTTITFTSAPPVGTANVYVIHLGLPVQSIVPPDEINIATTYTTDLTVQGAFTSVGIDDNATSTAMTLDSSGDLLVGKTSSDNGASNGFETASNGNTYITRTSGTANVNTVITLNRGSTDGDIARFQKDGTTVGSIGTRSGDIHLASGNFGVRVRSSGSAFIPTDGDGGTTADGTLSLGNSGNRFNNLYLSGGVYLGGTGSDNYLTDYEEGTWTPQLARWNGGNISATYSVQQGRYTKIGRIVTVAFDITVTAISSQGSSLCYISGAPFDNAGDRDYEYVGTFGSRTVIGSSNVATSFAKHTTNNSFLIRQSNHFASNFSADWTTGTIKGSITYEVE